VNPQDPLANLHPLRDPAALGWWPPALGWWLLVAVATVLLAVLLVWLVRRYRADAYRRAGLRQLRALRERHQCEPDDAAYLATINALLKSVALRGYPEAHVAAQSGARWIEFLNRTLPDGDGFESAFADAGYRPDATSIDLDRLHDTAARWIRRHRSMT
jgi:hypothetical protein